jgi:hypothetical protein
MNEPCFLRLSSRCLTAAALLALPLILAGCSKSRQAGEADAPGTNQAQTLPAGPAAGENPATSVATVPSNVVAATPSNPPAAGSLPDSEPARRAATLAQEYRAAPAFDDRFAAALRIGELGTADAVTTLEQLFRQETDKDLKVELVNALMGISGCKDERLRFLRLGIGADQAPGVREAAIDGLVDLEDARALALLDGLRDDPDLNIRTLATQSRQLVEQMLKSP